MDDPFKNRISNEKPSEINKLLIKDQATNPTIEIRQTIPPKNESRRMLGYFLQQMLLV